VYGTVAEIRRLRVVAQSLAKELEGSADGSTESTEEQSQQLTKSSYYLSLEDIHAIVGLREIFRYSCIMKEQP
jgi:hypothetical protein